MNRSPGGERSHAARFDLSVRIQLYAGFALAPMVVGVRLGPRLGQPTLVIAALTAAHALVCVLLLRAGLDHYLRRAPRPDPLIALAVGLTASGVLAAWLVYPDPTPGRVDGPASVVLLVLVAVCLTALAPAVSPPVIVGATLLGWAAAFALAVVQGVSAVGTSFRFLLVALAMAMATRVTAWMLDVVWQLDASLDVQASLAVAQERLRFARDLHDVLGQTLSVLALKAELAAQLARRGRPEAIDEMLQIRRIAQDSLADVRAVVGGFRSADLDAELAGARALLTSAGIDCRVIGDGRGLPERAQGTLGWVVREATTNVLRHSEARSAQLSLHRLPDGRITFTMENDRVRGGADVEERVRFGSGLIGVAERIAALGGDVVAVRHPPDVFRLTVELPAPAEPASDRRAATKQEGLM